MIPGIDPKVDYAFEKVFGSEANADLLRDLLGAVLGFAVSAVEIVNPFNDKDAADDKLSVLDVKARDEQGRWFNVEMQMCPHAALAPRLLYYWAKLYAGQMAEGKDFATLRPAYSVCFVNSQLFRRRPDVYHNRFRALDDATGELLTEQFNMDIVELPKFLKGVTDVRTQLERWCYYFKYGETLDAEALPPTLDEPSVRKAMEVLMRLSQNVHERDRYENRVKFQLDQRQHQADAANALEKGREQGLEQGRDEGSLYGRIQAFQLLLNQPETPNQELAKLSMDELQRLAAELQRRVIPNS